MGIYLNPGNEEFQKALNSKIYVDKTMLISEMNQNLNTEHQNICVSRPRRFGKSMTANMLVAYYNVGVIYECLEKISEAKYYYQKCGNYEPAKKRLRLINS